MDKSSTRETLLDAAQAVVLADGAAHLTLDAVADRAGVSKGGLLYHFPAKESLLQAMVDRQVQRIEQAHQNALDRLPPGPGLELRARVLLAGGDCLEEERRLGSSMLAATANDPRLLEPFRDLHRRKLAWLCDGEAALLPFDRSAIIALAVDGLCLLELLQISPYDEIQRRHIIDGLLRLVDETAAAVPEHSLSPTHLTS